MPLRLRIGNALFRLVRWIIFTLHVPAETSHWLFLAFFGMVWRLHLTRILRWLCRSPYTHQPVRAGELLSLPNQFGFPGGMFKNNPEAAAVVDEVCHPGFITIGGIPPLPQYGNTGTRVWRFIRYWREILTVDGDVEQTAWAIVNRLGFPSDGCEKIARRLRGVLKRHTFFCRLIIQITPNRATVERNPQSADYLDLIVKDQLTVARAFMPLLREGDCIEVGVSSPNTPGLLALFLRLQELLTKLRAGIVALAEELGTPVPLLLLKLPPDSTQKQHEPFLEKDILGTAYNSITDEQLSNIVAVAETCGFAALVGFNTTTDPRARVIGEEIHAFFDRTLHTIPKGYQGGVSGDGLYPIAEDRARALAKILQETESKLGFIGGGGIRTAIQAMHFMDIGADAVFFLSGAILEGPILTHRCLKVAQARTKPPVA